jgi:PAS domain S-box-containing protein
MPTRAAAVCLLQLASALAAAEPAVVRLAVTEGRDIRFAHLTSKDGLPPGTIRNILQDDQGFLWFNTSGMLSRYDGYKFKSYGRDPTHPNYPSAGFLHYVFKDRSGLLWVASNESLERFDPSRETLTRYPIDRNGPQSVLGPVKHISQDRAGTVWLSTEAGLHRLDPATGTFRHYFHDPADPGSLSSSIVRSTYEDREGTLWVCTVAGLDAFDRRTEKVTERIRLNVPEPLSVKALEDHAGVLWIIYLFTGSGSGVASWDRHTRRLTVYSLTDREPLASHLSGPEGIHEDADGNLWLATRGNGLVTIDPSRRRAVRYRYSPLNPEGINEDMLMSVFEDREGSIWVGTSTTGLDRFQRKPLPFRRYRREPGNSQTLLRTSITSVYADTQDNIWVGSSLGLTRIDGKSGEYSFFRRAGPAPANLSNIFVISIVEDRSGYLWFGTYGGLNRYDPRTGRFAVFRHNPADPHSLGHDIVNSLMVDHQGTLWAGTADGLSRLEDPGTGRFRSWKAGRGGAPPQRVAAMVEDPKRVLWLVSGTLQRFDPATERFTAYRVEGLATGRAERQSASRLIRIGSQIENSCLTIDRSGVLWVATTNGLLRFDRDREEFTIYDERDGLPANSVHGILEDRNGNLWVSTAGGLSRFDPRAKTFTNYYEADGLAGTAFEGYPAACKSGRGQMFFGSKSGLTSFWPEQIVEKPAIPPVVLTGFSLRNEPVAPGPGSVLAQSISFARSLTLSYRQNLFSFEFAALSYLDPQRNQYRYMLEPLDHSWNRVDADRRLATFTTLPAGNYTLRVQGSNNRGVWNEQGVTVQLQILPPWWATWQFRTACAIVLVALGWAAWQYRVRQLRREVKQLHDVIETIPALAWTVRPDGSGAFVNKRWTEYTGLSAEETAGTGWKGAVHPEDREQCWQRWRAALAAGEPFEDEARFRCAADRGYRWFLARGVPLLDKHGRIVRWYGILTDIEDRKHAEEDREKLRQLEADLAHINRVSMMGELAASIAHEVNQPLAGIVNNGTACLRWLSEDAPDVAEVREAVRDMVRDGKRAGDVIVRIRALTKRSAPARERLDLNHIVEEVLALAGDEAKRNRVRVLTDFASDLSPVSGDRVQLQQVILNLVMNAIEAMSDVENRARELVITTGNMDADHLQVSVQDSGPGLDPNTASRVFEAFYTTKAAGMGMGLSITRSIVENHGGRIWAVPKEGSGATFHVRLPKYRKRGSHSGVAAALPESEGLASEHA